MDQKMCFGIVCITCVILTENFNVFYYFIRKNTQNSVFPQCKTSIGNKSRCIKDRAVQFAYSRGIGAGRCQKVWAMASAVARAYNGGLGAEPPAAVQGAEPPVGGQGGQAP